MLRGKNKISSNLDKLYLPSFRHWRYIFVLKTLSSLLTVMAKMISFKSLNQTGVLLCFKRQPPTAVLLYLKWLIMRIRILRLPYSEFRFCELHINILAEPIRASNNVYFIFVSYRCSSRARHYFEHRLLPF